MNPLRIVHWAIEEAKEKIDLRAKWEEAKELGKVWGPRAFVMAIGWEIIEDVVFPLLAWYFGMAWLIPVFLIWHFEPIAYPFFFWCFRTYDRLTGQAKWEADRPAYSSHWRTAVKVLAYRAVSIGGLVAMFLYLGPNPWLLAAYIVLMTAFNFVHERIWHDSNFGIIVETDVVQPRRVIAKALTYRFVSVTLLMGALAATIEPFPWTALLVYQAVMFVGYLALETAWARSTFLIRSGDNIPPQRDGLYVVGQAHVK